jgi:hypothetical protein
MRTPFFSTLLVVLLAAFSASALAQQYKWVDKEGKTRYGDVPPPGVKATPMRGPATAPAPAAPAAPDSAAAAKDGKAPSKSGPLTPAEQEAEYRKRQLEADKGREKDEKAAQEAQLKRDNCSRAQEQLRQVESGQRIARTNAAGERYYLDDAAIAQETAGARKLVQEWCK